MLTYSQNFHIYWAHCVAFFTADSGTDKMGRNVTVPQSRKPTRIEKFRQQMSPQCKQHGLDLRECDLYILVDVNRLQYEIEVTSVPVSLLTVVTLITSDFGLLHYLFSLPPFPILILFAPISPYSAFLRYLLPPHWLCIFLASSFFQFLSFLWHFVSKQLNDFQLHLCFQISYSHFKKIVVCS